MISPEAAMFKDVRRRVSLFFRLKARDHSINTFATACNFEFTQRIYFYIRSDSWTVGSLNMFT
jgi:hypothetical protein